MATTQVEVEQEAKQQRLVGQPLKRVEDPKFIMGRARYIGDIKVPGMLTAAFVRAPYAHAKIVKIDASEALTRQGVVAVLTGPDMEGKIKDMPTTADQGEGMSEEQLRESRSTPRPVLAREEVNYVGEAVAIVLAEDDYIAEDAVDLVEVEYEPLEAVEDVELAMSPSSPRVHAYLRDNVADRKTHETGEVKKAFEQADEIVKVAVLNQRVAPLSLEPRGLIASPDTGSGILTVWISTQGPQDIRESIADIMEIPMTKVRVIAPDVGGGFGSKADLYPEDAMVCYSAVKLNRPVKWLETRRENILATNQGRGQKQYAELAVKRDGRILGIKTRIISDAGAYATGSSVGMPGGTYMMGTGTYDIPAYSAEIISVFTNKVPLGAYRGAGRPEAAYLIERSMSIVAHKLKLDPIKMRLVNFIPKSKFPFKVASGVTYDSGDYETNLRKALNVSSYEGLRKEQREGRQKGRLMGIGIATWVEIAGFAPGFGQTAAITVTSGGEVLIAAGGLSHGQGHATTFAQVAGDVLGIKMDRISVVQGDTSMLPWSSVTGGSRSGPVTGSTVLLCARKVRTKMAKIAAHILGLEEGTNMIFENEKIYAEGAKSKTIDFDKVAEVAYQPLALPKDMEPTIHEYAAYAPRSNGFPFGTHIAVVDVDKDTGVVKLLSYFAVDDYAGVLNPLVVEGQVHGGVTQGIGQALLEQLVYNEDGQLLTSTLADYMIPSADTIPHITWERTNTPTDSNLLGLKGMGEAGAIAATPTIVNAVEDALAPYGVVIGEMPLRPDYIKSLIQGKR